MEIREQIEKVVPNKLWFNLREACELKNLNYKTACNRKYLQPNKGKPDGLIGGKKSFLRETIINWLILTDKEILRG